MSTLAAMFFGEDGPGEGQEGKLLADVQVIELSQALQAIAIATGKLPIVQDLVKQIQAALGKPLTHGVIEAWKKAADLREFADPAKHPPGEQSTYVLGRHAVESSYTFLLEPRLNGRALPGIDLVAEVELEIESGSLLIRDGRIWELRLGQATGRGKVKVGETEIARVETGPVRMPATIDIGGGYPIPA